MKKLTIKERFRSMSTLYLDICSEEWEKYGKLFEEISPYVSDEKWLNYDEKDIEEMLRLYDLKESHYIKSITFGAMCLEAFIYDYAAHNLTDTYTKNYLDRIETVSKWVIVTKMITGENFPTDSKAFQDLNLIIKSRNDFVHWKSMPMPQRDSHGKNDIEKIGQIMKKPLQREIEFSKTPPYSIVIEVLSELRNLEQKTEADTEWWQLEEIKENTN